MNKLLTSSDNNLISYEKMNINFKDTKTINFDKISVFDEILLINDFKKLYSFKMDFENKTANYEYEQEIKDSLIEIIFIDLNNIFLKLSTGFMKYDLAKQIIHSIKFNRINNEILEDVESIYFNEKITFKVNSKEYLFGLIASSKGELFISSDFNENNDEKEYEITCDLIKNFEDKIIKIYFKKVIDSQQQEYLLVIIFAKTVGYLLLLKMNDQMTKEDLNSQLKDPSKWEEIYNQNESIEKIFFSIQFDSQMGNPSSLVILKDTYKFSYLEFNKDLSKFSRNKAVLTTEDIDFNADSKISKHKDIIGVHHYNSIIYICFRDKVYIYNMKVRNIIDSWNFEKDRLQDLYILDKQKFYYLIFLTSRNVYFSNIEQKFEDIGYIIPKTSVNSGWQKCEICQTQTIKTCSACKKVYYCGEDHQEKDWDKHKKTCTYKEEEILKLEKIEYKPGLVNEQRYEIFENLRDIKNQKNLNKATDLTYILIESNRRNIMKINDNKIHKTNNIKDSSHYSNVINTYKMYEDHICNILLLAHTIFLKKNKDETFRILNKLVKEMDEKLDFHKTIDIFCDFLRNPTEKHPAWEFHSEIEKLFLKYINLITTIAKFFYKLGEFSSYEIYIVKTVEKIEKVYRDSGQNIHVLAYAYLLMGNLYVELDSLGKSITLYIECLKLIEDPKENNDLVDIFIEANYNLGLLYFVTNQYSNAKSSISQCIKAKSEYKHEEITEQMANFYETMGEIELEYKNHELSYKNLQKVLEIRSKLPNSNDVKSKMKTNIMLDFLFQNLEKDVMKKNNNNSSQNDKTYLRGEERDLEDVYSFIKVISDEKGESKRKKETSKKIKPEFDIDEMEKFFLLMSKLTPEQLKVLNDTQQDILKNPSFIKLPIVFSDEFKNCIKVNQRLEVCNLKLMSLKRNKILKDPYQKIEVENLNYDALYSRNFQNNLTNIKNYFVVNKILKNWEINTKVVGQANNTQQNPTNPLNISNINNYRNSRISVKENFVSKNSFQSPNNSSSYIQQNVEKSLSRSNSDIPEKQEKINLDLFKQCIFNFSKDNYSDEINNELRSDDEILNQIYTELEKEDLDIIMQHPEIVFQYIELAKESEKTKLELESYTNNKKDEPKGVVKEYLSQEKKIHEEAEEDSIISYKSEKSEKSLKSKMEPSSFIFDTSNVNDERNLDKSHLLDQKPNKEEEEKKLVEEKANVLKTNIIENKYSGSQNTANKPKIPSNIENMLKKQNEEKNKKSSTQSIDTLK